MARYKGHLSDDTSSHSRRESSYRGRARGRGRGRYSKTYHRNHTYSDSPDHQTHTYLPESGGPLDYEDIAGGGSMEDRMNTEDLYDDRPIQEMETVNEGRPLQERISLPGNRKNGQLIGTNDSGETDTAGKDGTTRFDFASYDDGYHAEGAGAARNATTSGQDDGAIGTKEAGVPTKDPEELRQKVLESLAEKKKKAAEFMSLQAEGATRKKDQADSSASVRKVPQGRAEETGNPERDAAVDALLATFGSGKDENGASTNSRKNSDAGISGGPNHTSTGTADGHRNDTFKYDDAFDKQREHGRLSDYPVRYDQYDTHKASRGGAKDASYPAVGPEQREDYHKPTGYDEKDTKVGSRQEPRYQDERYERIDYPKVGKPGPRSAGGGSTKAHFVDEERRDPRYEEYYGRGAETRPVLPNETYPAKPARYPGKPELPDVDYPHEYSVYPPSSRFAPPPRDDHRYPHPPEADYAALYYRDLTEWLDVTGYHDYSYRQMLLQQRHRDARVLEDGRRYQPEESPAKYLSRPPRDDLDLRRPPGAALYTMPPPPPPPGAWDDREAAKRSLGAPGRPGYPLPSEDRGSYRADDMKGRRRPRDDDFEGAPSSAKVARHSYEGIHRKPSYATDSGPPPRSIHGDNPSDETEAVRMALSRRLASSRGRDPSPVPTIDRSRRRSASPRDFFKGRRSPGASPRFENEPGGRNRPIPTKFYPDEDHGKTFRDPRSSIGDNERKPFGRGRGRGSAKDFVPYERNEHYDRRAHRDVIMDRVPGDNLRKLDVRYFMIKSFNQENVQMAQQDNIWATQQKNAEVLEQAFRECRDVFLFFSINKSGKFQGYARMEGPPGSAPVPSWAKNLLWESSGPFRIRWISITDISFHRVAHLKNRMNENQPVLIGRDGQEIDPDCGAQLCKTIDETAAFRKIHGPSED